MTETWIEAARRWRAAKQGLFITAWRLAIAHKKFAADNAELLMMDEAAQNSLRDAREALVAEGAGKSEAEGVSVSIVERRGQVDWKSAAAAAYRPADHGPSFDAWSDEHRKPGSTVATVKEV